MRRMEKVWRLILEEVGTDGFICCSAENLAYDGKITKADHKAVISEVKREARRRGINNAELDGYGLWPHWSLERSKWIKAQIRREHR